MAKRFTDTNKYRKPFIRGLQGAYKLLWDYLYHDCDHAGIWIVDFEIAQIYIGSDMPVNKQDALKYFNANEKRIIEFDNGKKWFIPSFIEFQYGVLNDQNRAHNSVLLILKNKGLISSLNGAKDKAKDKDKDKDILNTRIENFKKEVYSLNNYSKEIQDEFIRYWTELNKSKTKMRWEMEKTWDTNLRLSTWRDRADKYKPASNEKRSPYKPFKDEN